VDSPKTYAMIGMYNDEGNMTWMRNNVAAGSERYLLFVYACMKVSMFIYVYIYIYTYSSGLPCTTSTYIQYKTPNTGRGSQAQDFRAPGKVPTGWQEMKCSRVSQDTMWTSTGFRSLALLAEPYATSLPGS
jgi:hypothetical protein